MRFPTPAQVFRPRWSIADLLANSVWFWGLPWWASVPIWLVLILIVAVAENTVFPNKDASK